MGSTYQPEDLKVLSERERSFVDGIEDESHQNAVACSLIQHRLPDKLAIGDELPDLSLRDIDGAQSHRLRSFVGDRPVLLAFGSYTWTPFRRQSGALQNLYEEFRDRAAMFLIYVAEAHPEDEWQLESNREAGVIFSQPKRYEERVTIAREMLQTLSLSIPTLVDGMDDGAVTAFAAWPERLFVADIAGKIAFAGGAGPFGFDPGAAGEALKALLNRAETNQGPE
jgi:hypothetical protein